MRYTQKQIIAALTLYSATGSVNTVIQTLGYPSNPMLYHWVEKYPEYLSRPHVRHYKQAAAELKKQAICHCLIDGEPVRSIAEDIGYTESIVYKWLRPYREKGTCSNMKKVKENHSLRSSGSGQYQGSERKDARYADGNRHPEGDNQCLKKDPGVDQTALRNREKAVIIGALKNKYSLPKLCLKLESSRSSYYYQEAALRAYDKYRELRSRIIKLEEATLVEKTERSSDLIPFWGLRETEDMIKIERIVPMSPFSRNGLAYERLIKILSLYRLTLDQARQEELLKYLFKNCDDADKLKELFINLSPFYKEKKILEWSTADGNHKN